MASKRAMPIAWHETNLKNMQESCKRRQQELARLEEEAQRGRERLERLQQQIARAKRLGKVSFDSETFGCS